MKSSLSFKIISTALLILGAVTLMFAQSAYWTNHNIFNKDRFTEITVNALTQESSREAIAATIVDRSLANKPVVKQLVGARMESFISGLLGSDLSVGLMKNISNRSYEYLTTENREDISVNISGVSSSISALVEIANKIQPDSNIANTQIEIPDEIILVSSDSLPNLSGIVRLMLLLQPILWLASLAFFAIYIYIGRKQYAKRVYMVGATVILVALLGILTGPIIVPQISVSVPEVNIRPLIENFASGFLNPFINQMYMMLSATLLSLLVFSQRDYIFKMLTSIEGKALKKFKIIYFLLHHMAK